MIDWNQIKTVFFDMDGTLLDLHFDNYFWLEHVPKVYAAKNNMTVQAAKEETFAQTQGLLGTLDWYSVDFWSKALDLDIMTLKAQVQEKVRLRPNVLPLLRFLQEQDKRLVLVTNAHPSTVEFKMCLVELGVYFDKTIVSHDLGLAKEQPGFWDAVQKIEPFDKTETLFVDDSLTVLQAAKAYGFSHLLGISQPDLHAAPRPLEDFTTIDDFKQLIET